MASMSKVLCIIIGVFLLCLTVRMAFGEDFEGISINDKNLALPISKIDTNYKLTNYLNKYSYINFTSDKNKLDINYKYSSKNELKLNQTSLVNMVYKQNDFYKITHYLYKNITKTDKFISHYSSTQKLIKFTDNKFGYKIPIIIYDELNNPIYDYKTVIIDYSVESNNYDINIIQNTDGSIDVELYNPKFINNNSFYYVDPYIYEFTPSSFKGGHQNTENITNNDGLQLKVDAKIILKFDNNESTLNMTGMDYYKFSIPFNTTTKHFIDKQGKYGWAIGMNASGVRYYQENIPMVSNSEGTINYWVKLNHDCGNSSGASSVYQRAITLSNSGASDFGDLTVTYPSAVGSNQAKMIFIQCDGGACNTYTYNCTHFKPKEWHMITQTWKNGNKYRNYVDGVMVSEQNNKLTLFNKIIIFNGDAKTYMLNGSIDQLLIYNRQLETSEIIKIYNGSYANQLYIPKYYMDGNYSSLIFNVSQGTVKFDAINVSGYNLDNDTIQNNFCNLRYTALCLKLDNNFNDYYGRYNGTGYMVQNSTGVINYSVYFDKRAYAIIPNGYYKPTNKITISMYVYSQATSKQVFYSEKNATDTSLSLFDCGNNKYGFQIKTINGFNSGGFNSNVGNGWHHYLLSYDLQNGSRLYIDGKNKTISRIAGCIEKYNSTSLINHNNNNVYLGAVDNTLSNAFSGWLDNLRIINDSISYTLIQDIFNNAKGTQFRLRTANSTDNITWSAWSPYKTGYNNITIGYNASKYFKYQIRLSTSNWFRFSPEITSLSIHYNNKAPVFTNILSKKNNSIGYMNWTFTDPEYGNMLYKVYLNHTLNRTSTNRGYTTPLNNGIYKVDVVASDYLLTTNSTYIFIKDNNKPNIGIISPVNNSILTSNTVTFQFKANWSYISIKFCNLYINNTYTTNFSNIIKNNLNSYSKSLTNGYYNVTVNCTNYINSTFRTTKRFKVLATITSTTSGGGSSERTMVTSPAESLFLYSYNITLINSVYNINEIVRYNVTVFDQHNSIYMPKSISSEIFEMDSNTPFQIASPYKYDGGIYQYEYVFRPDNYKYGVYSIKTTIIDWDNKVYTYEKEIAIIKNSNVKQFINSIQDISFVDKLTSSMSLNYLIATIILSIIFVIFIVVLIIKLLINLVSK